MPRVEQHRASDHHSRHTAARRRLGLLFRHQPAPQAIGKGAADQIVIAVGCGGTRCLVQLPGLDVIDYPLRAKGHRRKIIILGGWIGRSIVRFHQVDQAGKCVVRVARLVLIEIHRAGRRAEALVVTSPEDEVRARVAHVDGFLNRVAVELIVVGDLPRVALGEVRRPAGRRCQWIQQRHRIAISIVLRAGRLDVGRRLRRIYPGPRQREIADGYLPEIVPAETLVVVIIFHPRNHRAVEVLDFLAGGMTQ